MTRRFLTWLEGALAIGFFGLAIWYAWSLIMYGGYSLAPVFVPMMGAFAFSIGVVGCRMRGIVGWLIQLIPVAFSIFFVWIVSILL